jgi:hypothetical protein
MLYPGTVAEESHRPLRASQRLPGWRVAWERMGGPPPQTGYSGGIQEVLKRGEQQVVHALVPRSSAA